MRACVRAYMCARVLVLFRPVHHLSARMRSVGAREEARDAARLCEAAEIQERERRQSLEKRRLAEKTRDLKLTVTELERQVRIG